MRVSLGEIAMWMSVRGLVAGVLCAGAMAASAEEASEKIRLAPPQAMFRDSITLNQFVSGTLRFVLLHEIGHGFVDLYDIPVLGREEDAADRFATWWMAPDGEGQDGTDAIAAMEWWLASAKTSGLSREQLAWWDEHGIDEQRGFQIACLLYGADPARFAAAADAGLPEERRQSCVDEAHRNDRAWTRLLADGLRPAGSPPGDPIPVTYEDTTDFATEQAYLMGSGILEAVSSALGQWTLKPGIAIRAAECKEINAFWDPDGRVLTMCYELVRDYLQIATGAAPTG